MLSLDTTSLASDPLMLQYCKDGEGFPITAYQDEVVSPRSLPGRFSLKIFNSRRHSSEHWLIDPEKLAMIVLVLLFAIACLTTWPQANTAHINHHLRSVDSPQPSPLWRPVSCPCYLRVSRHIRESSVNSSYSFDVLVARPEAVSKQADLSVRKEKQRGIEFLSHYSFVSLSAANATQVDSEFHHFDLGYVREEATFLVKVREWPRDATTSNYVLRSHSVRMRKPACPVSIAQDSPTSRTDIRKEDRFGDIVTAKWSSGSVLRSTARQLQVTPRIVGGHFASSNLQGYMVAIYEPSFSTICSGTLISPRWVLTAAHCRITKDHVVTLGTSQAFNGGPVFRIRTVITHPSFEPVPGVRQFKYDIAVIELMGGPRRTSKFMRINDDPGTPVDGSFVRTIGYGVLSFENQQPNSKLYTLRQVDLPVVKHSQCQFRYTILSVPESIVAKKQICAGYSWRKCDTW